MVHPCTLLKRALLAWLSDETAPESAVAANGAAPNEPMPQPAAKAPDAAAADDRAALHKALDDEYAKYVADVHEHAEHLARMVKNYLATDWEQKFPHIPDQRAAQAEALALLHHSMKERKAFEYPEILERMGWWAYYWLEVDDQVPDGLLSPADLLPTIIGLLSVHGLTVPNAIGVAAAQAAAANRPTEVKWLHGSAPANEGDPIIEAKGVVQGAGMVGAYGHIPDDTEE